MRLQQQITSTNTLEEERVRIIPNPAYEVIQLINVNDYTGTISFYNLTGEKVADRILSADPISIKGLKPGIYFIIIQKNDMVYKDKLIVF
ncbi:MAG: T9SS type A sorting domain-containing protein [Bacteroidetes bacterium]|nr:T9SS type A sorting domain-containing protein [Bacteroidota bacterium]